MNYDDIIPTHNSLRKTESFKYFVENPNELRVISSAKPALVLRIGNQLYLNDAHHRLAAACHIRYPIELINMTFMDMTIEKMLEVNFKVGWVTPYDPRIHVRLNNCKIYKDSIMAMAKLDEKVAMKAILIAKENNVYVESRVANKMSDLIPNEWRI